MAPITVTVACFVAMDISAAVPTGSQEHLQVCHVPVDSSAASRVPLVLQVLSRFAKWTNTWINQWVDEKNNTQMPLCFSYPLLCNKLLPNLAAENNNHLIISHSSGGWLASTWEFFAGLTWVSQVVIVKWAWVCLKTGWNAGRVGHLSLSM